MSERNHAVRGHPGAGVLASLIGALMLGAAAATAAPAEPAAPSAAAAQQGDSPDDIRDIRGPQFLVPAWALPALLVAGALAALGGYRVWRRRRARPTRELLPFEAALQRLEDIRALMYPAGAREFSTAVSDIVRSYIEQEFHLTATHRTTEEFLRDLLESSNASLARHRALLSEFLNQCDLVKFAGVSLSLQNMESLHHGACAFVRATADEQAMPAHAERPHDSLSAT
jgi:hypothetical protein